MGQDIKATTSPKQATTTRREASLMEIRRLTTKEFNKRLPVETLSRLVDRAVTI